jgi:hypothetical protein
MMMPYISHHTLNDGAIYNPSSVNKEKYIDILHCLMDVVRRKCPEKWRTNNCDVPYDEDPAHWSVLVNDFLTKNNVTTLEHPPYPPDLAPADFYPLP